MSEQVYQYPGADDDKAYEWLNRCTDPEMKVESLIDKIAPWDGKMVVDVGAGSAFHALRMAQRAAHVFCVEPNGRLRRQAFSRLARSSDVCVSVVAGSAENIPAPDSYFHIGYARFAYFFGTDACLPGLREVHRVLQNGAHFFVIDVIPDYGEWGAIARRAYPNIFPADYHQRHEAFFAAQGFDCHCVETNFRAPNIDILAQVFKMDYPHMWQELLASTTTLELRYGIAIFHLKIDKD